MEPNEYAEILRRLAAGQGITLQTTLAGAEGTLSDGLRRSLVPVTPVTDSRGRVFAAVTVETDGPATVIREPVLPQERRQDR